VVYCLAASLLSALVALALARYLDPPYWVDALLATGALAGLSLALALGLILRRLSRRWLIISSLVLALGAALTRQSLLGQVLASPLARMEIDFLRLFLACSSVVWGTLALLWGVLATSDTLEELRASPRRGPGPAGRLLAAAAAVTLALYSVSPLGALVGLTLNHWTLLGLFALALVAYGLVALFRRFT